MRVEIAEECEERAIAERRLPCKELPVHTGRILPPGNVVSADAPAQERSRQRLLCEGGGAQYAREGELMVTVHLEPALKPCSRAP